MAEEQQDRQTDDLSEEASPYRLEKMRNEGRVAQSKELSGMIGLLATGIAVYAFSGQIGIEITNYMKELFMVDVGAKMDLTDPKIVIHLLIGALKVVAVIGLPIAFVGFIFGVLSSYIQVGSVFSTEPLSPDLDKINPIKGLQRLFSLKQLYDGLRLIVRAATVAFIAYLVVKTNVLSSPMYLLTDPSALLGAYGESGRAIFLSLVAALLIFAGFDFWLQKWEYSKSVRLTKKEAKEEHKEHEGDPLIRARIRSVQREMARRRMMQAVKTADVVVTNPTHIAVAIVYEKDKMMAPKVVAKGADFLAQKIKKLAADSGVPLVENVPLARTLFSSVKVGQFVPRALYQAVAEVLAYVYRLKNRTFK